MNCGNFPCFLCTEETLRGRFRRCYFCLRLSCATSMRNAFTTDHIMQIRPTTFVRHIVDVASENCERKDGRKSRRMLPGGRNISQPFKSRTPPISAQSLESLSPRATIRGDSISECTKCISFALKELTWRCSYSTSFRPQTGCY